MFLTFEQRVSDSPLVERVWRSHSSVGGRFYSMAEPNLELVVARVGGNAQVILRGPVTRATVVDCPANGEWLGVRFRLGAYLPELPTACLLDHQSLVLPNAGDGRFWLFGQSLEIPTFETAETFVARAAALDLIAREGVVERALGQHRQVLTQRSVQRRFLRATGLTRGQFWRIERARQAAHMLQTGMPVLDVVEEGGYFDQPHLTRALRRLIGPSPGGLQRGEAQLSFLYKTILPAWG